MKKSNICLQNYVEWKYKEAKQLKCSGKEPKLALCYIQLLIILEFDTEVSISTTKYQCKYWLSFSSVQQWLSIGRPHPPAAHTHTHTQVTQM